MRRISPVAAALSLVIALAVQAAEQGGSPFSAVDEAVQLRRAMRLAELHDLVEKRVRDWSLRAAQDAFLTAELMKHLGDERAAEFYELAISRADGEPGYELFYADYLRNFRGPRPVFGEAEAHYLAALRKLAKLKPEAGGEHDAATLWSRIDRGLVALYQEDGVPVAWSESGRPTMFVATVNRAARSTADLDEVHDTRDFTAEALYASSATRLGRPLTPDELRSIVRTKVPFVTYERIRFRAEEGWAFDFFYEGRDIANAQITRFDRPATFNDVDVKSFGSAINAAFDGVRWRVGYARIQRTGIIESRPQSREDIDQLDLHFATSHFAGPDKLTIEVAYMHADIKQDVPDPQRRNRRIAAVSADYAVIRRGRGYRQLFGARGVHLGGGLAYDRERYDAVTVTHGDVFAVTSVQGIGPFDLYVHPSVSGASVSNDRRQRSAQLRTDVALVARLIDEERQPGIPIGLAGIHPAFLHLVVSFRRDRAVHGLDAFESDRIGAGLTMKLFRRAVTMVPNGATRVRPTSVLLSFRTDRQRFLRLDREERLWSAGVSVGY